MIESFGERSPLNINIKKYLKSGDLNALHSLIEVGGECIDAISSSFDQESSRQAKLRIIRLAKEIRTPASSDLLVRAFNSKSKDVWHAALEGLAYQQNGDILDRLEKLLLQTKAGGVPDKSAYLLDLINTASEWRTRKDDSMS